MKQAALELRAINATGILRRINIDVSLVIGLVAVVGVLVLYNLEYNPRPWHDEGAALSLSKTLARDGIYAVKSSDGYQTFGPVQSIGPTVLLPVALSFKLFGVGLTQGRLVAAAYALLTVIVFYWLGRQLFGRATAVLAVLLLLGSPATQFLTFGRQVLGEVPAFGFFLAGVWVWQKNIASQRRGRSIIAGVFIGAAIITKNQYAILGFGTLAALAVLDLVYYRQKDLRALVIIGVVAFACMVTWWVWQWFYFGAAVFQENATKLAQLAASTTGFHPDLTWVAVKSLIDVGSDHLYGYWGIPALVYAAFLGLRRNREGYVVSALLIFAVLGLAYYLFWIIPHPLYLFAPAAMIALLSSKLLHDLIGGLMLDRRTLLSRDAVRIAAWGMVGLLALYPLQVTVRTNVLDRGHDPQQLETPTQVAAYLDKHIDQNAVVETWERELAILSDHRYHFPDQSLMVKTQAANYRNAPKDYALGFDYFQKFQPSYLVIGWYARLGNVYDASYLAAHACLLTTIGEQNLRYDVYQLNGSADIRCPSR